MRSPTPLDLLEIQTPCSASWGDMSGDDKSRFCRHCQKHVYDLSAMSTTEAERVVCEKAGHLCVQVTRDVRGEVVTLDYQTVLAAQGWSGRAKVLFALVAALISGVVSAAVYGGRVMPLTRARGGVSTRCISNIRSGPAVRLYPANAGIASGSTGTDAGAADDLPGNGVADEFEF